MSVPLLEVQNLSISFTQYKGFFRKESYEAVHDLSLRLYEKEIVAIVGASGSGKSLLAHALLGILPYNATCRGSIFYQGKLLTDESGSTEGHSAKGSFVKSGLHDHKQGDLSDQLRALRGRDLFLVPQSVSYLDPLMKVGPQIRKSSKAKDAVAKTEAVLSRYGLPPETEHRYPFELSGGMARRVLISTAVMEQPKIVIADEPTPGLPTATALRVLSHFREIAEENAAVLLITHDLELAIQTADRILVFHSGTVLEDADCSDFQDSSRLRHPYTKALYQAIPGEGFLSADLPSFDADQNSGGCPFLKSCPYSNEPCSVYPSYRELRNGYVRCVLAESIERKVADENDTKG